MIVHTDGSEMLCPRVSQMLDWMIIWGHPVMKSTAWKIIKKEQTSQKMITTILMNAVKRDILCFHYYSNKALRKTFCIGTLQLFSIEEQFYHHAEVRELTFVLFLLLNKIRWKCLLYLVCLPYHSIFSTAINSLHLYWFIL